MKKPTYSLPTRGNTWWEVQCGRRVFMVKHTTPRIAEAKRFKTWVDPYGVSLREYAWQRIVMLAIHLNLA